MCCADAQPIKLIKHTITKPVLLRTESWFTQAMVRILTSCRMNCWGKSDSNKPGSSRQSKHEQWIGYQACNESVGPFVTEVEEILLNKHCWVIRIEVQEAANKVRSSCCRRFAVTLQIRQFCLMSFPLNAGALHSGFRLPESVAIE